MASKAKSKKAKAKRKPAPKATLEVKVTGKLKGTGRGEYGYSSSTQTFDWEITDTGKVGITAPCGTTYKFDKKTIRDFADLIDKAGEAKVVFE